jgi:hypothetical protein
MICCLQTGRGRMEQTINAAPFYEYWDTIKSFLHTVDRGKAEARDLDHETCHTQYSLMLLHP